MGNALFGSVLQYFLGLLLQYLGFFELFLFFGSLYILGTNPLLVMGVVQRNCIRNSIHLSLNLDPYFLAGFR